MKNKKPKARKRAQKITLLSFFHPAAVIILVVILMVVFFVLSREGFAATIGEAVNEGLKYGTKAGLGTRDVREVIFLIINVLLGFLSVVAVLIVMYAGALWMTSRGDPRQIEKAKKILVNAVIGLIILFSAYSIAAFVLRLLVSGVGLGRRPPPAPPPIGGCVNCGALGGGIIESIFPPQGARDVPRDTIIIVSFKEVMDAADIISGGVVSGDLVVGDNNVKISWVDPDTKAEKSFAGNEVTAQSSDNRTFVFRPKNYLGDGIHAVAYTVWLGKNISKAVDANQDGNKDPAFPGAKNYFSWWFEVGTRLDLAPPQVKEFFPIAEDATGFDDYSETAGAKASGKMTVKAVPKIYAPSRVDSLPVADPGPGTAGKVLGTYLGNIDAKICLQPDAATNRYEIYAMNLAADCDKNNKILLTCLNNTANVGARVVVGCGVSVEFESVPGNTVQYSFQAKAEVLADTLRAADAVYTFVKTSTKPKEIQIVEGDIGKTIDNIVLAVNNNSENPDVVAKISGADIIFEATLFGSRGNSIQIFASGSWADPKAFNLSGGADASTAVKPRGAAPDVSRDVIIRIDFTEAMYPPRIGGVTEVDDVLATGVGKNKDGSFDSLRVYADFDNDGPEENEQVSGTWKISNGYLTAEFISSLSCGVCPDGATACVSDNDCAGGNAGSCSIVKNSCGDVKKCLPVPKGKDAINYVVRMDAAHLRVCADACPDPAYAKCEADPLGDKHCASDTGIFFPKADDTIDGLVDTSVNSLDGNRDSGAQGRAAAARDEQNNFYQDIPGAGYRDTGKFDGFEWRFNVNKTINLNPPKIEEIGPKQDEITSLLSKPRAKFNKLMMSSSLLPDNSYEDGLCGCGNDNDCFDDERCDAEFKVCRKKDNTVRYCAYSSQCKKPALECKNQSYVTLIDTLKNTGYSVSSYNIDETLVDGFPDKTMVEVPHSLFTENQAYHIDIGSGVKDIYQNCFLPSTGPGCSATAQKPYCCYGVAQDKPCTPSTKQ